MYSLKRQKKQKEQQGAVAVIVAASLTALIGIGALAVDLGYLYVVRNELQNVADGAALAATRQLGSVYEPMSYAEQQNYVCSGSDKNAIVQAAVDVGAQNYAGGQGVVVDPVDIEIGRWNSSLTPSFTSSMDQPDAVRVTVRKDGEPNVPAMTFLAKVFGIDSVDVSADATAALTGLGNVGEGELEIPVGISKAWFKPGFCNQPIKFHPTGTIEGCAGWNTFDSKPASASEIKKILKGLEEGSFTSPEANIFDTEFEFKGGVAATAFEEMKSLYDAKKDPITKEWQTTVVVYNRDDCSNPNKNIEIVGFATAIITEILESPDKIINAKVKCESVEWGRGSGGNFGTKGSIPGLVE